jgi:hypothetical protein
MNQIPFTTIPSCKLFFKKIIIGIEGMKKKKTKEGVVFRVRKVM